MCSLMTYMGRGSEVVELAEWLTTAAQRTGRAAVICEVLYLSVAFVLAMRGLGEEGGRST